jgi:hypothetical protein
MTCVYTGQLKHAKGDFTDAMDYYSDSLGTINLGPNLMKLINLF